MVVWQRPDLLVLDEPTNHLDLDMRHAMEVALQAYEGALILVSHDRHLLRNTVEQLLLVHDGTVEEYGDDLAGYEKWILAGLRSDKPASAPTPASTESSRREKRQQAAAQRARLRPLKQELERVEQGMAELAMELEAVQRQLSDNSLYTDARKDELAGLLREEGDLKSRSDTLEERWLTLQEELELLEVGG
jgi:ATP-binding cassette subfamily F protein 3